VKTDERDALGMNRRITRRDFCNGASIAVLSSGLLSLPSWAIGAPTETNAETNAETTIGGEDYPPSLTGLRGAHPGAFEVAHALAREGCSWDSPGDLPGDPYDLIVVGSGISGLAAAYFFRERMGKKARTLVLDNHDDFGGHAKRNEFRVGSRLMVGYGGSQSIDSPGSYSPVAKKLIKDLAIDTDKFYQAYDRNFFTSRKLKRSLFFDRATYGVNRLVIGDPFNPYRESSIQGDGIPGYVKSLPISAESREQITAILTTQQERVPKAEQEKALEQLRRQSYNDYLRDAALLEASGSASLHRAIRRCVARLSLA